MNTIHTGEALLLAYWEDRGAQLANELERAADGPEIKDHNQLALLVVEELTGLDREKRGQALEAVLRGYRLRMDVIRRGDSVRSD